MASRRHFVLHGSAAAAGILAAGAGAATQQGVPRLQTRFGRQSRSLHPLVCAGMAFVCDTPALALAVCRAGGVGSIAASLLSPATLRKHLQLLQTEVSAPFHVNFLTPFPHAEQLAVCVEQRVPVVSFHWGLPPQAEVDLLKRAGIQTWMQVGRVSDARRAHAMGFDCLMVQGSEAGGHNYGRLPLTTALSEVRDELGEGVVLLAAGGIVDGSTGAAAIMAGADGIVMGTRFVATEEANAHMEHKKRIVAARGSDTVLTGVYGPEQPDFNPMRVITNKTVETWQGRLDEIPHDRRHLPSIGTTMFAEQERPVKPFDSFSPVPETTGDFDQMPVLAGQGVGLIKDILPAADVVSRTMGQMTVNLARFA